MSTTASPLKPSRVRRITVAPIMVEHEVDASLVAEFLQHVHERMKALALSRGGLGQLFTSQDLSGINPSLVNELQPYSGADMTRMLIDLCTVWADDSWLRNLVKKRRVRKLRRIMTDSARMFEHATPVILPGAAHDKTSWAYRAAAYDELASALWAASRGGKWDMPVEANLDAVAIVQFLYLPEQIEQAAAMVIRNNLTTYRDLRIWRYDFDRFFAILCKLARSA